MGDGKRRRRVVNRQPISCSAKARKVDKLRVFDRRLLAASHLKRWLRRLMHVLCWRVELQFQMPPYQS